jgi:large repetitive protein
VHLTWTAADGGGNAVSDYQVSTKVDSGSFSAFVSVGNVLTYEAPCDANNQAAPDSTCTFVVRAVNSVGTGVPSNQASAAALVDDVAPTVTITTPANGSFPTTNKPPISGTAGTALGDATTVNVTIKLGTTTVQGPFTANVVSGGWSVPATAYTAPLADGVYTVTATQTDWGGNASAATAVVAEPVVRPVSTGTGIDTNLVTSCTLALCDYEVRARNAIGAGLESNDSSAAALTDGSGPGITLVAPAVNGNVDTMSRRCSPAIPARTPET